MTDQLPDRSTTTDPARVVETFLYALRDGDFDAAATATARATRRFVRKQRSWFRRDKRIHWFDGAEEHLADRILSLLAK